MARQKNDGRGRLGGRRKGTPNKTTSSFREMISELWWNYQESGQFKEDIASLDPQTRAVLMERYAQYMAPKMKSVDMEVTAKLTHTIEDRLLQLSGEDE